MTTPTLGYYSDAAHILRHLKFKRARIMVNGSRKYVYQRPKWGKGCPTCPTLKIH